jgi:hypothetical protein
MVESRHQFRKAQETAREDLKLTREQLAESQSQHEATQKATLLAVLYDQTECGEDSCPPKSSSRARAEAVLSLKALKVNDFSAANLSGVNLSQTDLSGVNLSGADLTRANLFNTDLTDANLSRGDLRRAKLTNADLRRTSLSGADLREASLIEARLGGANFSWADLREALLYGAEIDETDLREANFSGADVSGAYLLKATGSEHYKFVACNLTPPDLINAETHLIRTSLHTARNFTQAQIDSAKGDSTTILPEELARPAHWPEVAVLPFLPSQ